MVMPTSGLPSRRSSAATVELSTPPDIATAIGLSGMGVRRRNAAQVTRRIGDCLDQLVNLLSGVLAAQGEAHTRSRGFRAEAHREQDVRWLDGSARAGRSARHCESTKVERDHHCLTFNAFKAKIARVREAVRPAAVDDDVRYFAKDASFEPIAKGGD